MSWSAKGSFEVAKLAGVTVWLGVASWLFQSVSAGRIDAARESELRNRTATVLAHYKPPAAAPRVAIVEAGHRLSIEQLEAFRKEDSRVLIDAGGSPSRVADSVDHASRRVGLAHVRIECADRKALYWVVFELARRGYDHDEIQALLGQTEQMARKPEAIGGGC